MNVLKFSSALLGRGYELWSRVAHACHEGVWRSRGIALPIRNLGIWQRWWVMLLKTCKDRNRACSRLWKEKLCLQIFSHITPIRRSLGINWIFIKHKIRRWNRVIWLRLKISGGLCIHSNSPSHSIKWGNILSSCVRCASQYSYCCTETLSQITKCSVNIGCIMEIQAIDFLKTRNSNHSTTFVKSKGSLKTMKKWFLIMILTTCYYC
jgi:hypothetical protein